MNLIDQKLLFYHHGWVIEYWHGKIVPENQSVFKPVIRHDNGKFTAPKEDDEDHIVDHHDRKARRASGYRY